ncbi:MAG: hypothetical protein ACE37H_08400 [Phycisphaeraceae bacterium]
MTTTQADMMHHIVYWTIPQIDADGVVVSERHYAVNLAELEPDDARRIETLLEGPADSRAGDDTWPRRTDPQITEYRHLFRPFIEVKRRAGDLCRFSAVWLPFTYAEYADPQGEPRHHRHPAVRALAGTG